jgi:hypothetical protein
MTKYCGKCHKEKPKTEFNASSKTSDGLQSMCRRCQRDDYDRRNAIVRAKADLPEGHETRQWQRFISGRL